MGGQDDIFVVAPADPSFAAVTKFEKGIYERCEGRAGSSGQVYTFTAFPLAAKSE